SRQMDFTEVAGIKFHSLRSSAREASMSRPYSNSAGSLASALSEFADFLMPTAAEARALPDRPHGAACRSRWRRARSHGLIHPTQCPIEEICLDVEQRRTAAGI